MHPFANLNVLDGAIGLHWFGQSSFALKDSDGTTLHIDPYFPHSRSSENFIHPEPPLDESTLPVNAVLLTHDHGDHTCSESIVRIEAAFDAVHYIGPCESAARLSKDGVPDARITIVSAGDSADVERMRVHAVRAKPPQGDPHKEIAPPNVEHLGYVIDTGAVRVYISGDPINTFADHEKLMDPIRRLHPDIGILTCHPTEGEFPFFAGSAAMATGIGLKTAVPAHYNCFVKRNYDPQQWARHLPPEGPEPLIIGYNESIIYELPSL